MRNLIADLKLFLKGSGQNLILKHDFHWGDHFLDGYAVVDRQGVAQLIEFCSPHATDQLSPDFYEFDCDEVDHERVIGSLSLHSSSQRDVEDMIRLFGDRLGDCHWLDQIAGAELEASEDATAVTLTPELLEAYSPQCFPYATTEAIKILVDQAPSDIDLSGLAELAEEAAKLFTGSYDLNLSGLTSISDKAAKGLSKHTGTLDLSGLDTLSLSAAEHLAQHDGSLYLGGLTEISDEVAQALSKHHGTLTLTGLTSLSDTAAEALSKHDGEVELPDFDGGEDEDDIEEDEEDEE